jgi:hypothetical protein
MDRVTRRIVTERAGQRCEYCGMAQEAVPLARFHVEHIIARQHGGSDDEANLALACHHCNLHKGPNLTGIDPETRAVVRLFHPRLDARDVHFQLQGRFVVGLTPIGRATVRTLAMNYPEMVELRPDLD